MNDLNVFKARSTWVAIFTLLAHLLVALGYDGGLVPDEAAGVVVSLIDAVGIAWVYFERVTGRMKLVAPWNPAPPSPAVAVARRGGNRG